SRSLQMTSSFDWACESIIPAKSFTQPRGAYWSIGFGLASWGTLALQGNEGRHERNIQNSTTLTRMRKDSTQNALAQNNADDQPNSST
ncbi:MAG: hypothetical protein ABSG16_24725, partial [Candidatus Acidiferrum sp.]